MSDSEDLVTKVPDRLLERLVSLFLHQKPSAEYRVMLIAAGGSESLAVWGSTLSSLQQTLAGGKYKGWRLVLKVIHKAWGSDTAEIWPW